jgi:hypothetical protein
MYLRLAIEDLREVALSSGNEKASDKRKCGILVSPCACLRAVREFEAGFGPPFRQ